MAKYERMGKAIKAAMITNGLQHKDLLSIFIEKKGSPITRGALSHWISGTIKPSEEHLDILCDILNLNPHELFDTEEQIELIYKVTTRAPWYNDAIQLVKDIENCKKSSISVTSISLSPASTAYFILRCLLSIVGTMSLFTSKVIDLDGSFCSETTILVTG